MKLDANFGNQAQLDKFYANVPNHLHQAVHKTNEDLCKQKFDTHLSGSTMTSVLFDRNTIFTANAGDSRAVLYSFNKAQGGMKITPLTEDHKPCMPVEKRRVLECGGRVDAIKGSQGQNLGPMRVWLKDADTPGLAMSRSMGDGLAHSVGVSTDPEIKRFELTQDDKFIIVASDGVWEFLSNHDIAKIVWPFYIKNTPEQAGNAIVRAAAQTWRDNDTVIDDITCVTIFLEVDQSVPHFPTAVLGKPILNPSSEY